MCLANIGIQCAKSWAQHWLRLAKSWPRLAAAGGFRFTVKLHPARKRSPAKGVWQKSDEKSDRSIRKSDRKVTESVPKTKKVIELLLPHSFCGTLKATVGEEVAGSEKLGLPPKVLQILWGSVCKAFQQVFYHANPPAERV